MPYTDFHYTPTGTGVISGKEVLEQTEDAINDLGGQISGDVQTAIDTANNALNTANTASADAQNAVNTANTAYTTATNAQNTANAAQNTASNALTAAQNAQNDVNALGNRVTTAENNITQNTTDISGLTTRMGTAEGNITTLQNDVITAQGTATSAQNTATMARQQAYVLRYSSTAITDNSTIAYSTLDNTDNIKADDKIIDVDGKIFSIVSVDSDNSTVTVGSALIDLALDANVVHTSGNETVTGNKTFSATPYIYNSDSTANEPNIIFKNSKYAKGDTTNTGEQRLIFTDSSNTYVGQISSNKNIAGTQYLSFTIYTTDNNNANISSTINYYLSKNGDRYFSPYEDGLINLGSAQRKWKSVYANNYYYGSNNVEFSTKFVTTDTNQTISGNKTFSDNLTIYNSDNTVTPKGLTIRNAQWGMGESGGTTVSNINFLDKNSAIPASVMASKGIYGQSFLRFGVRTKDSHNNTYAEEIYYDIDTSGNVEFRSWHDNTISLGTSAYKWKDVQTKLINGLTPSSLSLPNVNINSFVDISGYFTNTGNGDINTYSVTANGWVYLRLTDIDGCQLSVLDSSNNRLYGSTSSGNLEQLCLPVTAGTVVETQWTTSTSVTVAIARFIPCQGNI